MRKIHKIGILRYLEVAAISGSIALQGHGYLENIECPESISWAWVYKRRRTGGGRSTMS